MGEQAKLTGIPPCLGKSNVDVFKHVDCSPGMHNQPVLLVDSRTSPSLSWEQV